MLSRWLQVYSTTDAAALNFLASRSQPRHVDMLHLATWLRHLSSFYSGITSKLTSQKLWQPCGPSTLRRAWWLFRGFGKSGRFSLGSCEALRLHCHWIWPPLKMWWPCCGFIWDCFALSMNENVELQIFIIIIMHPSSVPKAWKHSKLMDMDGGPLIPGYPSSTSVHREKEVQARGLARSDRSQRLCAYLYIVIIPYYNGYIVKKVASASWSPCCLAATYWQGLELPL